MCEIAENLLTQSSSEIKQQKEFTDEERAVKETLLEEAYALLVQDAVDQDRVFALISKALGIVQLFNIEEALLILSLKPGSLQLAKEFILNCDPNQNFKSKYSNLRLAVEANIRIGQPIVAKSIIKNCGERFKLGLTYLAILEIGHVGIARFIHREFGEWDAYVDAFGTSKLEWLPYLIRGRNQIQREKSQTSDKEHKTKQEKLKQPPPPAVWEKTHETAFQNLFNAFENDPERDVSEEEFELLKRLSENYIFSSPTLEIKYYEKLVKLFNISLEIHFKENPKVLENYDEYRKFDGIPRVVFPIFEMLQKYLQDRLWDLQLQAKAAYAKVIAGPLQGKLSEQQKNLLEPNRNVSTYSAGSIGHHHLYPDPEPKSSDISSLSYKEMATHISEQVQAEAKTKFEMDNSVDKLIESVYPAEMARALYLLVHMYQKLDVLSLMHIPHICRSTSGSDFSLTAKQFKQNVFPHAIFIKAARLHFNHSRIFWENCTSSDKRRFRFLSSLVGSAITLSAEPYKDYAVQQKIYGRDQGFVLVSKDSKRRYFAKTTGSTVLEYFCCKVASHFIKIPEARLEMDEYGNAHLLTMDFTRSYTKGNVLKTKECTDLGDLLFLKAPKAAFDRDMDNSPSPESQEKVIAEFLDTTMKTQEARVSFAKILLLSATLGFKDVCDHGGNIVLIKSTKNNQTYYKFGLVDFDFKPSYYLQFPNHAYILRNYVEPLLICPIFKRMYQRLLPGDFLKAAQDLVTPKTRTYNKEGFLLVQYPRKFVQGTNVMDMVYKEVVEDFKLRFPHQKPYSLLDFKLIQGMKGALSSVADCFSIGAVDCLGVGLSLDATTHSAGSAAEAKASVKR